ncbi:BTB/POZ domain-containing protein 2 [Antechinus flavipes]|uniref:BTB/POZ domain-containing protein 2 n=1 Tax=Antechinus flavipes TaxID=38775 RepID=UPI0022361F2C|nr:BTB/POZ domain-containing protein 2 [Antechinus flavipes]
MRRCCPALFVNTPTAAASAAAAAAVVSAAARPLPLPLPQQLPTKMAAGGSGGGLSSCPPGVGNGCSNGNGGGGGGGGGPGTGLSYNNCSVAAAAASAPGNPAAASASSASSASAAAAAASSASGGPGAVSVQAAGGGGGGGGGAASAVAAAVSGPGPAPTPAPPGAVGAAAAGLVLHREPVYNWQATKPTVKERFAFLFNNEVLSDVHFLVGKGMSSQRIPAHRFVLAVGSAVFDAMFNGGMATTSTEIELPDVEPAAFLALLKFLYSDEVQIGPETVMTTLYTAKKYAVPALEAHCVEFLKKNLRADNAFMLLTQARLFDEPQLASLCLENIDKNTSDAINAEGFTDIDLDTLVAVLERDTLGIREVRLFNAVVRWSEAECQRQQLPVTPENKRKVLGKALSLIRFPLMTIEEFAAGPAQSGILTDREVVSLFLHFTVNPKPRVEFIDRPRCCLRGKECSINRFQQVESRWGYSGTSDRIRFSVNKRIFVVGFGLYGSIHGPTDYQVNIQIIHTDSNTVLGQNDTGFSCDGSSNTFRVMFKEPVEILPNVNYTACATLKGPDSHYGTKGLRKVIRESPTTGAKTCFTFCYAAGNNNGTSVEDGQIPEIIFYT